ncbi:MAG: hypothetical protein MUE73_00495 [Planctomycetes bacterium]|jgi:predicted transcriptional regulator|nr:hypothetical protein [Planctomycetota bacterium]
MALRRNLHVLLDDDLHRRLHGVAERKGEPATVLAREAIRRWVEDAERAALREEISAYAAAVAGTEMDLDADLETAATESLHDETESPPARRRRQ